MQYIKANNKAALYNQQLLYNNGNEKKRQAGVSICSANPDGK